MRTFGVEEEFLLVDAGSGSPLPASRQLLLRHHQREPEAELVGEFQKEMVEAVISPYHDLEELRRAIKRGRSLADDAAARVGARAVALATSPLRVQPHTSDDNRYRHMVERYGTTARNSLVCGLHVHVAVESDEEGVAALDRIRVWLPVVMALSCNSPYSNGEDTGYSSYRTMVWGQWQSSGPTDVFGSVEVYRAYERQLLDTGVLLDDCMLYFDARLSRNHPTLEIRVADICGSQSAAVTIAGLCRGLVETAVREWKAGRPPPAVPSAVLKLCSWEASLRGLTAELVHPGSGRPQPAQQVVAALFAHVSDALAESGDAQAVASGLRQILANGTGSEWQRRVFQRTGSLRNVVREAIAVTHSDSPLLSA